MDDHSILTLNYPVFMLSVYRIKDHLVIDMTRETQHFERVNLCELYLMTKLDLNAVPRFRPNFLHTRARTTVINHRERRVNKTHT